MRSFIISIVLSSVVVSAYSDKMVLNIGTGKSPFTKDPSLKFYKVLTEVVDESPQIYGDDLGNAIVFARVYAKKSTRSMIKNGKAKKTPIAINLGYSAYNLSHKKWSKQRVFLNTNTDDMGSIVSYQLLNYKSKNSQILFYTSSMASTKLHGLKVRKMQTSLWAARKKGLLGSWGKSHKIVTIASAVHSRLTKSCSSRICVVAWREDLNSKRRAVTIRKNVIYLKSLKIGKGNDLRWSIREQISIPQNHNILQHKMVVLDSSNLALVWLAAVKTRNEKFQLKIFAQMRISGQWRASNVVATLGSTGVAGKLSEFTVNANRQRKILITWSEYLATTEFKAVIYNMNWRSVGTIYKDNPEVRKIFPYISGSGKIVVYWQQKYGKYPHVFSSEFSPLNSQWSIPKKIDKGPQIAMLKNRQTRGSESLLMWVKNFKVIVLVLFNDNTVKHKEVRLQQNVTKDLSSPAVELFNNGVVRISWLKAVKSGFEIWVQNVHVSHDPGRH